MAKERKIQFICRACRWLDKVNGNTYHSVRVTRVKDNAVVAEPLQYGYGEHYRQTALTSMAKNGWLPKKYIKEKLYMYERENNYPIYWDVTDGLKRDAIANSHI